MIKLYADEQFPLPVVKILRNLEYDILTVQDAGKADQKIPDPQVLVYATSLNRAVLTMNRRDLFAYILKSLNINVLLFVEVIQTRKKLPKLYTIISASLSP